MYRYYTVKDLIEKLKTFDENLPIRITGYDPNGDKLSSLFFEEDKIPMESRDIDFTVETTSEYEMEQVKGLTIRFYL